jgi:hypothetical protein
MGKKNQQHHTQHYWKNLHKIETEEGENFVYICLIRLTTTYLLDERCPLHNFSESETDVIGPFNYLIFILEYIMKKDGLKQI